jgi:hypothetical protein
MRLSRSIGCLKSNLISRILSQTNSTASSSCYVNSGRHRAISKTVATSYVLAYLKSATNLREFGCLGTPSAAPVCLKKCRGTIDVYKLVALDSKSFHFLIHSFIGKIPSINPLTNFTVWTGSNNNGNGSYSFYFVWCYIHPHIQHLGTAPF